MCGFTARMCESNRSFGPSIAYGGLPQVYVWHAQRIEVSIAFGSTRCEFPRRSVLQIHWLRRGLPAKVPIAHLRNYTI